MNKVTVSRKAHFNAAHRLYRKDWSDAKNEEIFDKCSNPYYHGHNYELIVSVTGQIDSETGYVMDMKVLKDLIKLEAIFFEKDQKDTRIKHIFLNEKGEKIFEEVFSIQKKRIYNALLKSSSEEVINFDNVLSKIING